MATYKPAPQGQHRASVNPLRPGVYSAQIIQVQVKFSKCGTFERHSLRVRVEDAANDHWEDFWENLTFSEKAMWKVEQALQAVGLDAGVECEVLPEYWLEKRCRVQLAEREGRLEIKRWLPTAVKAPVVRAPKGLLKGPEAPPDALSRLRAMPAPSIDDDLPF